MTTQRHLRGIADSWDGFKAGKVICSNAGSGVQLPDRSVPRGIPVIVKARDSNTSVVYLGRTKTISETTASAFELKAGGAVELKVKNTNKIFMNSKANNEGIDFFFESD